MELAISTGATNDEIYQVRSQLIELIALLEENVKSQEDEVMKKFLEEVDPYRNDEEQVD